MKKPQDKVQTVDTLIAKLDKKLIQNGYKPTEPTNKTGTFVHISNKPKGK